MYKDCLGNTYSRLPRPKPTKGAKPSKGGRNKIGRNRTNNNGPVRMRSETWQSKVKSREASHRANGQKFVSYPC